MPPVILEIIVNADKGIAELQQLDKALSDTTKATQQQTPGAEGRHAEQHVVCVQPGAECQIGGGPGSGLRGRGRDCHDAQRGGHRGDRL